MFLEKLFWQTDRSFTQKHFLFFKIQSGFRSHHSTETALVRVTNDLLMASHSGLVSKLMLLDLSAAFVVEYCEQQYQRLECVIGIIGTALLWFKSYLSNRFQFVHVNGVLSSHSRISYGVPQDSLLGPLLSNICFHWILLLSSMP